MLARTNSKSIKKELVIESPQKRQDATASEAEVNSPVEVLVRAKTLHKLMFVLISPATL